MEKVILPREVAEAIEDKIAKGISPEQFVEYHATGKGKWDISYLNTLTLDTVIRALYIGYEVEETPEDKVRALFNFITPKGWEFDNNPQDSIYLQRSAIRTVLDILNIKIEGVNA